MDNFADGGLLSSELENIRLVVRTKHAAEIEIIESINRRAVKLQYELQVQPRPDLSRIIESLYARTLFYIQSAILLIDRGLDAPARVLLRASLDVLMNLCAAVKDVHAVTDYVCDDTSEKSNSSGEFAKVANSPTSPEAVRIPTSEWKASTKATCDALQAREVYVAQLARTAGLEDLYNNAYQMLSFPVRSMIRGLERDDENDDDRALVGEPTTEGMNWLYVTAGKLMVEAIQITATAVPFVSWVPIKAEQFCAEARAQLKELASHIEG